MRALRRNPGLFAALFCCLGVAAPASAGDWPDAHRQCGSYENILEYFASVTVFTGTGLSAKECSQLCKRTGGECRDAISQATKCTKKALGKDEARDVAYVCKPQDGQAEKDCKNDYGSYTDGYRQQYDAAAPIAKGVCDSIRDACIADCEGPAL